VKQQRILLLCSDAALELRHFLGALSPLFDVKTMRALTVRHIDGLHLPRGSRWNTFCAWGPPHLDLANVAGRLESVVKAMPSAVGTGEEVLAVFADPGRERARAYLQPATGFARSLEGELFHVLREASGWLEIDPVLMMRYGLQGEDALPPGPRAILQNFGVQLGASAEPVPPAEPLDEDDRFVEQKLAEARALIARYRAAKKPD
jgi:hypothetical protein